jgi:hypothetical protein
MLYNFNLKSGDVIDGKIFFGDTIQQIDTILDNRRVYYLSDNHWEKRIFEGIGTDRGLLENDNEDSYLVCFMKNYSPLYHEGSGSECNLDFNNSNYPDCDKLTLMPKDPLTSDEVELITRVCYQVSKSDPYYPVLSEKKLTSEENVFYIESFYEYNDQNASDDEKTVCPLTDTTSLGTLAEGYYAIKFYVHTIHFKGEKIDTAFYDKVLNFEFKVSQTNKIKPRPLIGKQLKVYPVPAKGTITVETNGLNEKINSIEIFDILGTKVVTITKTKTFSNPIQIDIQNLNKGVYFIKLNGSTSGSVQKILVE